MKSASCRAELRRTFAFKGIRLGRTEWQYLFLVGREFTLTPAEWNDPVVLAAAVWVGVVSRAAYTEALTAKIARDGTGDLSAPHDAAVSVDAQGGRSWLGPCVKWTRFGDMDTAWWARFTA